MRVIKLYMSKFSLINKEEPKISTGINDINPHFQEAQLWSINLNRDLVLSVWKKFDIRNAPLSLTHLPENKRK